MWTWQLRLYILHSFVLSMAVLYQPLYQFHESHIFILYFFTGRRTIISLWMTWRKTGRSGPFPTPVAPFLRPLTIIQRSWKILSELVFSNQPRSRYEPGAWAILFCTLLLIILWVITAEYKSHYSPLNGQLEQIFVSVLYCSTLIKTTSYIIWFITKNPVFWVIIMSIIYLLTGIYIHPFLLKI